MNYQNCGNEIESRRRLLGMTRGVTAAYFNIGESQLENLEFGWPSIPNEKIGEMLTVLRELCAAAEHVHYTPRLNTPAKVADLLYRYRRQILPGMAFYSEGDSSHRIGVLKG